MGHFKPTFLEALGKEWAFEDGADIIVTVDGMLFFYVASGTVISAQDSKLKVESEGGWARLRKVVNEGAVLVRLEARLEAKFIIMPSPPPPAKTPQELNLTGGGQGTSIAETRRARFTPCSSSRSMSCPRASCRRRRLRTCRFSLFKKQQLRTEARLVTGELSTFFGRADALGRDNDAEIRGGSWARATRCSSKP